MELTFRAAQSTTSTEAMELMDVADAAVTAGKKGGVRAMLRSLHEAGYQITRCPRPTGMADLPFDLGMEAHADPAPGAADGERG